MTDGVRVEPLDAGGSNTGAPATSQAGEEERPSLRQAYWTLFVLGIVVMFTVLDRQIMALMIEPIKQDFQLTDVEASFLLGAAFSLPYAVGALPIARYADTANRRNLIAVCIAFWSFMTVCCGLAQSYVQMILARMGIGVGESGYGPAAWSILTDTFPREKVAFATGTMAIGAQAGTGLALIIGGSALLLVAQFPPMEVPLVGLLRPWQWAFILVGAPGILWAMFLLVAIREPARRGKAFANGAKPKPVPVKQVFGYLWENFRTFASVIGGHSMKYLLTLGTTAWMPTLFVREFGWDLTKIGLIQGSIILVVGPIGLVLGGKLSEYLTLKGVPGANMKIVFYVMLLTVPISMIFPLMPSPWLILALYGVNLLLSGLGSGPATAASQVITPNSMRAQVSAVKLFSSNVIAYALGPLTVALLTDYFFKDPQDLKYSLSLAAVILGPPAVLIVWQGLKPYAELYEKTASEFED